MNITGIKRLAKSLSDDKRESKYKYLYSVWVLENSDKWFIDGVEVSEDKKFMIKCANYNIKPKPESFVASKTKNGKELYESDFLKVEIKRIEQYLKQLIEDDDFIIDEKNLNSYILELKSKLAPKEFAESVVKNQFEKIALDKKSIFFYSKFIVNWYNQRKTELENNDNLNTNIDLLDSFLFLHRSYFTDVIKIIDFSINYNYQGHEIMKFEIRKTKLKDTAISLSQFSDIIKKKTLKGNYIEAIKIHDFCLQITDEVKSYLVRHYKIEIKNTFLENQFNSIIEKLKNSIDLEKIKFLKENEKSIKKQPNTLRPNRTDIAYFIFYTSQCKELILSNNFPSDKAWNEIGDLYNKNWKNIQTAYNIIANNKSERLKKSKKKNLNYVIEEMLNDYPKAKKEAQSELNTLKLNS